MLFTCIIIVKDCLPSVSIGKKNFHKAGKRKILRNTINHFHSDMHAAFV